MSGQLELDGRATLAPAGTRLSERQRFALEAIAGGQPLMSDELGAELCARRGRHGVDERCGWDGIAGRDIARALEARGLVRYQPNAGWVLPSYQAVPS